ncbi:DUF423 domain-containing protein [uncultured Devosia sp.]|uniref:DUF423 domain-containing protein n=1 Tax=uncultured Devosia sp. TaxID=211434 RepID=UPI00262CC360|nr:DUF423 domain-containing protein [uncultured Devosia sp.]
MMQWMPRLLMMTAGLMGAAGVAAAAAASHGESRNMSAIATIFLAHAPVLLALGLAGRTRPMLAMGLVMIAGTLIFGVDLALREVVGQALFPGAAPLGGGLMILAWLGVTAAGFGWKANG